MNIEPETIRILVDADACPVKAEIYRVAERHNLPVMLVANSFIAIPAMRSVSNGLSYRTSSTPLTTGLPRIRDRVQS